MSSKKSYGSTIDPTPTNFDLSKFINPEMRAFYTRYALVALAIVFSCISMFIAYGTPDSQTKHFYFYLFLCTVLPDFNKFKPKPSLWHTSLEKYRSNTCMICGETSMSDS